MDKTILYMTDSQLDEHIAQRCREILLKAAGHIPIVSVSQKPLDFGTNICVGPMKRCWLSLFKAQMAGLEAIHTPVVAFAEHDNLYTYEHFMFEPKDLNTFYFNDNVWLGQWSDINHPELKGMYSYWPNRAPQSQLICGRNICLDHCKRHVELIDKAIEEGDASSEEQANSVVSRRLAKFATQTPEENGGRCKHLSETLSYWGGPVRKVEFWMTKLPNVDIRHGANFSGPKRGTKRRYELAPWGRLEDVLA